METITLRNGVVMPQMSFGVYQVTPEGCMIENLDIFDFSLIDIDMAEIAKLDTGKSLFFDHHDGDVTKMFMCWFARIISTSIIFTELMRRFLLRMLPMLWANFNSVK